MYTIEARSVLQFLDKDKIKLPRFQRKTTWDYKQNFELAISIFQDYPVGVVIINKEKDKSWLLDGRQRRTALNEMWSNPDSIYNWAKQYIKFPAKEAEDKLKKAFWDKVDAYLQDESSNEEDDDEESNTYENIADGGDENETDIDKEHQREGLNTLLELILMAHRGSWKNVFGFSDFAKVPYAMKKDNYVVNPVELRKFILNFKNKVGTPTEENLFDYFDEQEDVKEGKENAFKKHINMYWDKIVKYINVVEKAEKIFNEARIGVIQLRNVTPLDAQNIFSRINSGGTPLKAEELLSAKPFWNIPVSYVSPEMLPLVNDLYTRLGVELPEDNSVVRWDYGATLISRIDKSHLLFDDYTISNSKKDEVDMTQITLGFKIISSYYQNGMSAICVNKLESNQDINWGSSIDDLANNINIVCDILLDSDFFKFLNSWKKSISKLLGNALVLEFLVIILKDWEDKGKPKVSGSSERNSIVRDAKILFDKLVYEYAMGYWRGSGDSKMASHIINWRDRIKPVDQQTWNSLIDGACEGDLNGQSFATKHLTPIVYYSYVLQKQQPNTTGLGITYDVDHIIPQAKLIDNKLVPANYKDSLVNLALLPKKDNINKKDKFLSEIPDSETWLKQTISNYTGIPIKDFGKYSDLNNINDLKSFRHSLISDIFTRLRVSELAN